MQLKLIFKLCHVSRSIFNLESHFIFFHNNYYYSNIADSTLVGFIKSEKEKEENEYIKWKT